MKTFTNFRKSVLTVLAVLISVIAFSQFSRNQAIELVMNDIVGADSFYVNVFSNYDSHILQQDIVLYDNRTINCTYENNWVFFIDDDPIAFWFHECRYVFVSGLNGDYTVMNENLFPVDLETDYELISELPNPEPISFPEYTGGGISPENPNDHLFAVLVGGTPQSAFWTDISLIYNTLITKGYKKENIFVHFADAGGSYGYQGIYNDDLDGPIVPSDDIDYDASLASLQTTFDNLSGISTSNPEIPMLGHGDQLLIHFDSHGNSYDLANMGSNLVLAGINGVEFLYDYDLATMIEQIDCAQMLIVMQQCFSGGFIDDLSDYISYPDTKCKNRRIVTAVDYDETARTDYHLTGPVNVMGKVYGEFDLYFYSALWGFYPDVNIENGFDPWEISANQGEFPFYLYPTLIDHPGDYNPDEEIGNNDGIIQIGEAYAFMDDLNTWTGENIPNNYYMPYPGIYDHDYPQQLKTGLFHEDLFTLAGLVGEVKTDQTVTGNFLIGGNLTIEAIASVNISSLSELYLQDGDSRIYVDGELHIGENVLLKGQDDVFMSLLRTNTNSVLTIGPGTEFNKMRVEFTGYPHMDNLIMDDLDFVNFDITGSVTSIDVLNCEFNNGWMQIAHTDDLYMDNCDFNYSNLMVNGDSFSPELSTAVITNSNFTNVNVYSTAVKLEQFPKYIFSGNSIKGYQTGLSVFNSGEANMASISDNTIFDNTENGIGIYNSHAYLRFNNVYDNGKDGLALLNNSYVKLSGNKSAKFVSETQRFRDNGMYEIFSDQSSFPEEFKWNAVIDEDNEQDGFELVYCDTEQSSVKDVRYNYWGSEENFHPEYDFYPLGDYIYLPLFKLDDDEDDSGEAETMFYSAENDFEQGDYTAAKNGYKQVVEQYTESKFAKASIKQLFSVEEYEANDYNELMQYFRTNSIVLSNPDLEKLAEFFANKCDIKLENWQDAIDWFENEIQNPTSFADSLYAIIDLGNTYLLMEQSGYKSAYSGNMIEHIPSSTEQYNIKRGFLISLLPQDNLSKAMKGNLSRLNEGELLQNVPNPFKGSTQIWYKINAESNVQINVYNYTGQLIKSINEGIKTVGPHYIDFDASGLKNGIYFYSISINGKTTDSKKMTVME
jgi:hypothetical protein